MLESHPALDRDGAAAGSPALPAALESDLPNSGSYVVVDVDGESVVLVRGRDSVIRGFYNVCRHRGTAVTDETCGTAVRFQCPYHAWIYDLEGRLVRAKHTDGTEDFSFEAFSLQPVGVEIRDGGVHVVLDRNGREAAAPAAQAPSDPAPSAGPVLTQAELDAVRRPYRAASLLPGRAYHDEGIHAFERREWFRRDWIAVGREEDVDASPRGLDAPVDGQQVVVERRADGSLAAAAGGSPVRVETWQGFVFVSFDADMPPLVEWLDDLPAHLGRFDFGRLRSAHQLTYDIGANWKLVAENYSECYHCPGLHPQLNHLTPYDLGGDYDTRGPWQGGWMELTGGAETMALQGGRRGGRPALSGMTAVDERRIDYYLIWPTLLLSIHPDYLLVHRLIPDGPERTRIVCDWLFDPATIAAPGFDATDVIAFWDMTNKQDWHVCELQQRGTGSRSWKAGRYSDQEPSVHAFDLMVADRYAADAVVSRRTVREHYDGRVVKESSPA
jgi:phenylpropionate dioxygenase-like ring-hydroxylating dioxygenase large terminal subunit